MTSESNHENRNDHVARGRGRGRSFLIERTAAVTALLGVVALASGFGSSPAQNITAELRWAGCLRSHGVPSFPDPNSRGVIDSGKFDPTSPAFQTASKTCASVQPTGPISAVPGRP
jgi:hypothetical protein